MSTRTLVNANSCTVIVKCGHNPQMNCSIVEYIIKQGNRKRTQSEARACELTQTDSKNTAATSTPASPLAEKSISPVWSRGEGTARVQRAGAQSAEVSASGR